MRERITSAHVLALIAIVLAVGGNAVAFTLGKNSVGTKQLKKNAVTTQKIKNEAVTAAKVKKGTLTGTQINSSTLGTVPVATNATNATIAANASHLGGQSPSSYARTELEPVHYVGALVGDPAFAGSCENYDPTIRESIGFYKDSFGIVHLVGSGKNCLGEMFTLPNGFRPGKVVAVTGKVEEIVIGTTGEVICLGTTAAELDGITFRAAS